MTWSAKSTRQRMERNHAFSKGYRSRSDHGGLWRKLAASRRHEAKGFYGLVATLSAITFVGVSELLTPGLLDVEQAYVNCDDARAAGAAPVHRGEPGYGPHLDRDEDGVGCEWTG